MAVFIAAADGNLSSAAGVWGTVETTAANAYLRSVANTTALTTAYVESVAFTPGAITIDGIGVLVRERVASPTGTISVRLAQGGATVAGTEVTINVSDIERSPTGPQAAGDYFFKFAAPVVLLAATAYTVSAKCSVNGEVTLYRNATAGNWSRMVRRTTLGNPAAGDNWHVLGEWTAPGTKTNRSVTMDETAAVDYGDAVTDISAPGITVGKGGTLSSGVAAATNYILQMSTNMRVWQGGIFNVGTVGGELPRGSTFTLQFDCAADGDFGLTIEGQVNLQGLSYASGKNFVQCKLNGDEAAGQTVLSVDTDTGWPNAATIWIASTTRTGSQTEERILNGAAGATTITVTVALTNAHSGTSPTQAEIMLHDRPIVIKSLSATAMSYVLVNHSGILDADWVRFQNLGVNADGKRGLQLRCTAVDGGSANLNYCGVDDFEQYGIYIGSSTPLAGENITISNTTIGSNIAATQEACMYIEAGSSVTLNLVSAFGLFGGSGTRTGFDFEVCPNLVATNLMSQGCVNGFNFQTGTIDMGTYNGITAHSNSNSGIVLTNSGWAKLSNVQVWRNNGAGGGISLGTGWYTIDGGQIFGNGTAGNQHNIGASTTVSMGRLRNLTIAGDSTFAVDNGIFLSQGSEFIRFYIENCDFGPTSGIFVAHAAEDIFLGADNYEITLVDTVLRAAQEIDTASANPGGDSFISYQRQDGVTNIHVKTISAIGTRQRETVTFRSASPSLKLSPNGASLNHRLESSPMRVRVDSGQTVSVAVWVRKDASYSGQAPRLMLRMNAALGVNSDTLMDTFSAGINTWEQLTGTTPVAAEDGVFEFYVDVTGTGGAVYVDDWSAV